MKGFLRFLRTRPSAYSGLRGSKSLRSKSHENYALRTASRVSRAGFTLIEILIVVGITAMLSGAVLTYTSTSRDRISLSVEEAKLAEVISRAKSLAITTYAREDVPCGYGVSLDYEAHTYELFAFDAPSCRSITSLDEGEKSEVEQFVLPPNVRLGEGEERLEHVLFIPPDPKTWIWRLEDAATSTTGSIYLTNLGGTSPFRIVVGQGGQISF